MYGRLEVHKAVETRNHVVVKPEFASTVPPELWSEEQKREMEEYERKEKAARLEVGAFIPPPAFHA